MTIRDEALGALSALAGHARGGPDQPHPAAPGQLEQDLAALVGDPMADRSRIHQMLARLTAQAGRRGDVATAARLAMATVLEVDGPQVASELLAAWRAARNGAAGGCPGCAAELEVRVLGELGRYTEAADLLSGLPAAAWCPESDAALLGAALLPLLGAGHGARALAWHGEGLRRVAHDRARLHLLADHLDFLRLTGNGPVAVELVRTHTALLRAGCTAAQRLRWLTAAAQVAAEQVDAGHGDDLVTVAWPQQPTEPMTLAEFSTALHARAVPLAAAFDARNRDRRRAAALAGRGRHDRARTALVVDLGALPAQQRRSGAGRRPVTLQDVLACPDPYTEAEEAVLSCTLVDPVGVWQQLVLRAAAEGRAREAAARAVLARVLCLAGDRGRCLAEAATAEAMNAATGDQVAVAATKATAAASWVPVDPRHALTLAELAADQLDGLPHSVERTAASCRARSAMVGALLALDRLDDAERWIAGVHPAHPGQQVRVATQRALVLRRRGRLTEAADVLREAGRIADEHGLVALGVETRMDLAEVLELLKDTDGAVSALTRALLDLPHVPEPDPLEVPRIRMDLARVLAEAGRLAPARAELERARGELPTAPHTIGDLATVDYLLGIVLRGLRQLPAALARFEAAAASFAKAGRPDGVALAERDRGSVLFVLDRGADAAEAFDAAAEASRAAQDDWHGLACRIDAAQVRGYDGATSGTDELRKLREGLAQAAASGASPGPTELAFQTARVDHALAHCALACGEVAAAAELAEQALAGYRAAGADRAVAALSVDAGSWWWQAGDTGSALRYLRGAMRSARALGDGQLIARCSAALHSVGDREADIPG